MTPSMLFHNLHNGTFEERGAEAGVAYNFDGALQAGMGIAVRTTMAMAGSTSRRQTSLATCPRYFTTTTVSSSPISRARAGSERGSSLGGALRSWTSTTTGCEI